MATTGTVMGMILQVLAVSTSSWYFVDVSNEGLRQNTSGKYLVEAAMGLWQACLIEEMFVYQLNGSFAVVQSNCILKN